MLGVQPFLVKETLMKNVIEVTDQSFDQEVVNAGLPVVVDFWAPWCGPCRAVGPVLEELAGEFQGKVKITKLNTDQNRQVPMAFGVRSIPMIVLMNGKDVLDVLVGARPKADFQLWLNNHLAKLEKNQKKAAVA
jgi:thioredoxin 1